MSAENKTYRDFDLLITSENGRFFGQVLNSPAGQLSSRSPLKFPWAGERLTEVILRLENAMLRSASPIRSGPKGAQERTIKEFGRELFGSAIASSSDIHRLYESSRAVVAVRRDERLRLKLRIQAPELAQLPWEFMYDARDGEYVTFEAAPIARYLESSRPSSGFEVDGPLRILGMVADPGERDPNGPWEKLSTDDERHRIDQGIAELQSRGEIDFQWVPGGTATDLLNMVGRGPWHIFHFIGHGGAGQDDEDDQGFIVLEDELGKGVELPARKLVRILGGTDLRLAVLNCCESGRGTSANPLSSPGASLVNAGLSAVVAMQFPISDLAAIKLAAGFYGALANGKSVDAAVRRARVEMNLLSDVEWGIPVLYTRSSDGQLFTRVGGPAAKVAPAETEARGTSHGGPVSDAELGLHGVAGEPINPESGTASDFRQFGEQAQMRAELEKAPLEGMSEAALLAFIEAARATLKPKHTLLAAKTAEAHYQLARLKRRGNLKDAFVHYNAAIELNPSKVEYYLRRANVKAMLGQHDSALKDVQTALALDESVAELHWTAGLLHTLLAEEDDDKRHLEAALQFYTEAIRLAPDTARYYDSRSTVHTQRDEFEQAIGDLARVIELDPGDLKAYRRRGLVRERAGDADGAAQDFARAAGQGGGA